ncbi:hypothetical protein DFP72DRAFT_884996 [Ephemerocybe angulata]|uniref:SnoaL-like domain-containing protein n=1 Tax=Ephemerocybe angulata TaxID=980116 RepID=A0A8H6I7M7_9AGAR|nr:hypothetical protein DFP72DRAFT_884996 [Tulosesus angulatus]
MRYALLAPIFLSLVIAVQTSVIKAWPWPWIVGARSNRIAVCDYNAPKRGLLRKREAAIADYARIILEQRDVQAAFDKYIPGEYIQHSSFFSRSGREHSIEVLIPFYTDPGLSWSNLRTFASGDGNGVFHYKLNTNGGREKGGETYAVIDIFRFKGTCIVEHWDAVQQIFGNETNPIAFF